MYSTIELNLINEATRHAITLLVRYFVLHVRTGTIDTSSTALNKILTEFTVYLYYTAVSKTRFVTPECTGTRAPDLLNDRSDLRLERDQREDCSRRRAWIC